MSLSGSMMSLNLCQLCASTHVCTSNLHTVICFTQTHCDDCRPALDRIFFMNTHVNASNQVFL
jgi:hypothetical protein